MTVTRQRVCAVVMTTAVAVLVFAQNSLAAPSNGEQTGHNVGHLFDSWGKDGFKITGLIALALLLTRKIEALVIFVLACVVVGGFVFAGGVVGDIITGLWRSIGNAG